MNPVDELRRRTGVAIPVVGAPMAGIAGGALAAAVSSAGGLGLIGGGYGDVDWIKAQLALTGDIPVGVGLITWRLDERPDVLDVVLALPVLALMLSFGDPTRALARAHDAGVPTICQVHTVDEARLAADHGAAVIVAQGHEAGGHGRANDPVLRLVADIATAVGPVPVLAAGGITTVDDARVAVDHGAAGVLLGTRLYATREALDSGSAKSLLVGPFARPTARTRVFDLVRGPDWPAGYDGRAVVNDLVERWHGHEHALTAVLATERERYRRAAALGDLSTRVVWAGTGAGRIERIATAAEVVAEFAEAFRHPG